MSLGSGIRSCICATTSYENFSAEITINQSAIFCSRVLSGISYISKGRLRCCLPSLMLTHNRISGFGSHGFSFQYRDLNENKESNSYSENLLLQDAGGSHNLLSRGANFMQIPYSGYGHAYRQKAGKLFYLFVFVCVCVLCVCAYISGMLWCWWRSLLTL